MDFKSDTNLEVCFFRNYEFNKVTCVEFGNNKDKFSNTTDRNSTDIYGNTMDNFREICYK